MPYRFHSADRFARNPTSLGATPAPQGLRLRCGHHSGRERAPPAGRNPLLGRATVFTKVGLKASPTSNAFLPPLTAEPQWGTSQTSTATAEATPR
ncbi:hypothetical protein NL676_002934 [Syzygium grande]|nr:hypothetical protein NL676_002934 [Syzygium grande]